MLRNVVNACLLAAAGVGLGAVCLWILAVAAWHALILDADVAGRNELRRQAVATNVAESRAAPVSGRHRRAAPLAAPTPEALVEAEDSPLANDPILKTIAAAPEESRLIMVELNALRHSVAGEETVACISPNLAEALSISEALGLDLLEIFDRMLFIEESGFILSGHFDALDQLPPNYGERARLFNDDDGKRWAVWNGELVIFEERPGFIEEMIDGLEGRRELPAPGELPDLYGELFFRGPNAAMLADLPIAPETLSRRFTAGDSLPATDPALLAQLEALYASEPVITMQLAAMEEIDFHATLAWDGPLPEGPLAVEGTWRDKGRDFPTQARTEWRDGEMTVDWHLPRELAVHEARELCHELRSELDESLADVPFIKLLLGTAAMSPEAP